ncbi:lytic murein transglycosylase [Allokutzneria sp. A3M-2-11 16]|uniref:lytic transglycosylase domain-containing protein n=1 Tax=Allokutzneria sp. A3M-2-11 16 TaxID=2962043 RepID=UPI0020B8C201|nr:lytic murein transglycosylase [Allokutzneria sp. A3M-2-11 16]MCP3798734.1 lytic murein transglycosylase [Allokutzneria sp. A3M-2-11 16]
MVTPAPVLSPLPPRRGRSLLGRLLVVGLVLGIGGLGLAVLVDLVTPTRDSKPETPITAAPVRPGSVIPGDAGVVPAPQGAPAGHDPLTEWATKLSNTVDVPARALRAYALADLAMRVERPRCRLSWATVAGIGRIESNHGRYGGATLTDEGRPSRPIIGIPLDGGPNVRAIPDSDGGTLDGDTTWDRAVGPLQFIPGTWKRYAADGNGDGRADPQQIDDAAVTAARYLCSANRDLGEAKGWWAAVFSYNNSTEYGQKVFGVADTYARRSLGR